MNFKKLAEESPEILQKVLRALKGESDDAVAKLGSGKNLEALQKAKMNAPSAEAPAYPKNVQQDDLGQVNKEFSLVGEPQTKDFTMPHPEATVPAVRGNTLPEVVDGGTTLPVVRKNTLPDIDAEVSPMLPVVRGSTMPTSDIIPPKKSNFLENLMKGGSVALGLGGGAMMMGSDDEQAAQASLPEQQAPAQPKAPVIPEKIPQAYKPESIAKEKIAAVVAPETQLEEVQPAQAPISMEDAYLAELKAAQAKQQEDDFIDNMLRAGITTGAALGRSKADYSGVDALQKQNGQGVQNVKDRMSADMESKKLKSAQQALNDEKLLRDPTSEPSIAFRNILSKLGIPHTEKTTAFDAKTLGINPQNFIMQERAEKSREKIAGINAESKSKRESKQDEKMIRDFRRDLTSGELGKLHAGYTTAIKSSEMIEEFAKDPTGYSDYGTLMNGLKTLQGDQSVVREAEIKLGMEAGSLKDQIANKWSKQVSGKSLQPSQRQAIIETTRIMSDIAKNNYLKQASPLLNHANRLGFDQSELLGGDLVGDSKESAPAKSEKAPAASSPKETVALPKAMQPGKTFRSGGQTFIVNADGKTATEQ